MARFLCRIASMEIKELKRFQRCKCYSKLTVEFKNKFLSMGQNEIFHFTNAQKICLLQGTFSTVI